MSAQSRGAIEHGLEHREVDRIEHRDRVPGEIGRLRVPRGAGVERVVLEEQVERSAVPDTCT